MRPGGCLNAVTSPPALTKWVRPRTKDDPLERARLDGWVGHGHEAFHSESPLQGTAHSREVGSTTLGGRRSTRLAAVGRALPGKPVKAV
jgi:hypothetical protein